MAMNSLKIPSYKFTRFHDFFFFFDSIENLNSCQEQQFGKNPYNTWKEEIQGVVEGVAG
jgi:hypothetical protein